jgi:N-acetylneuraminate synthase
MIEKIKIIAEIGINHNGDLNLAKKLIILAKTSGCDIVKFQKRTNNIVYSKEELYNSKKL